MGSVPSAWNSLDRNILQKSADFIASLSQETIETAIIENCNTYLEFSTIITSKNVSISYCALLGVEGAAIVAEIHSEPETTHDDFLRFAGMVRLIYAGEGILPVVLIFPRAKPTTLEHECIHLCQLLDQQPYQLTLSERRSIFNKRLDIVIEDALNAGPLKTLDLLIRIACYQLWIELEAHYFTAGKLKDCNYAFSLAQRSVQPFDAFMCIYEFPIAKHVPNAMEKCITAFTHFCNELELHVEWIRDLISKNGGESLYDILLQCKEDDRMIAITREIERDIEEEGDCITEAEYEELMREIENL